MDQEKAREFLEAAITQTKLSVRAFARVMAVDERTVWRWRTGKRDIPGPVVQLCRALLNDPQLASYLGSREQEPQP